jgi:hypothetical protein
MEAYGIGKGRKPRRGRAAPPKSHRPEPGPRITARASVRAGLGG